MSGNRVAVDDGDIEVSNGTNIQHLQIWHCKYCISYLEWTLVVCCLLSVREVSESRGMFVDKGVSRDGIQGWLCLC